MRVFKFDCSMNDDAWLQTPLWIDLDHVLAVEMSQTIGPEPSPVNGRHLHVARVVCIMAFRSDPIEVMLKRWEPTAEPGIVAAEVARFMAAWDAKP